MENQANTQVNFFNEVKSKILPNQVLVDVIADELNLSNDSAYRPIRGETSLSLDELKKLCNKFGISLDTLFSAISDSVIFRYRAIKPGKFDYMNWIGSILENMKSLKAYENKKMIYGAKDMPLFYFFIFPKLAAFKLFFWMRNINSFPGMDEKYFDPEILPGETLKIGRDVWSSYIPIPSIEIWSEETIVITLRQIEYYYDTGRFKNKSDALELLQEYKSVIQHVQKQATAGCKMQPGQEPAYDKTNFQLYLNEVIILDNTVHFKMGDSSMVHLGHNVMNILSTIDPDFCNDTLTTLNSLIKNSTLISSAAEKDRNRFFNSMFEKIDRYMLNMN